MKKLISIILSVTMVICMVPGMAFAKAADKNWKDNGRFSVELQSGRTTAKAEVYDDYSVYAEVKGKEVDAAQVNATMKMKNVESLGVKEERSHTISLKTGLTQKPDVSNWFQNLYKFKGATVNGKIDNNDFSYIISEFKSTDERDEVYALTATPEDVEKTRTAWHALTEKVATSTAADDSQIIVKKGAYLQIGTEKMTFDEDCNINPSNQNGGSNTETVIRKAVSLITDAEKASTNVEMYLPKESKLQVGGTIATLNKALYVRSDLNIKKADPLETLRKSGNLYDMLFNMVTMTDGIIGDISDSKTIEIDVLSECMVKVGDENKKSYAYGDTVTLPDVTGKVWKNTENKVVSGKVEITRDETFTQENAVTPEPSVPSVPVTPNKKTETKTEVLPNGDQVTTTTTTNTATGAVTEKVETVKPDGTKSEVTTETKTDKKADGTVVQKEDKTTVETGKDGKKTETKVEKETTTRPDGTATETTTTTNADKSKEIVEKVTSKNNFDNKVTEETTTTISATGEKTVEQTTKIDTQQVGTITVDVQRDAEGKVTDATAEYAKNGKDVKGGTKVYLNGNHAKQIGEALGDDVESVEVTVTIKTESGENSFTITAQTKDLKADKELYIVAVDKDGNQTLVNATTYKTSSVGSISAVLDDGSNYQIITKEEKDALVKAIKDTIAPKAKVKAVTAGKTSKIALKNTLNRANVKSITYKTSKKSVATVSKTGKITGKKAGKVTISAVVTLKDGSKKTVKMTVNVKVKK